MRLVGFDIQISPSTGLQAPRMVELSWLATYWKPRVNNLGKWKRGLGATAPPSLPPTPLLHAKSSNKYQEPGNSSIAGYVGHSSKMLEVIDN